MSDPEESLVFEQSSTSDSAVVILPSDKYDALIAAYARKSKEHNVLRSAVVRGRGEIAQLAGELATLQSALALRERDLKNYADEVDRLAALHDSATKRVLALQTEVETVRAAATAPKGSMLGALLSSANWEAKELARISEQLGATSAELEVKVAENEHLHMTLFETRQVCERYCLASLTFS
jgi:hypothetical protein